MAVDDLWLGRDGQPTKRHGRGQRWRVRAPGYPATLHRTKAEAERVNAQRIVTGPPRPQSTMTVGDLLDRWLAGKQGLSKGGLDAATAAAAQVRTRWGSVLAADVERWEVQAWITALCVRRKQEGQWAMVPASSETRHKALQALRGALLIGAEAGIVEGNPCLGVKVPQGDERVPQFLTVAQLRKLAALSSQEAMVMTLGTSGMRIGECCRMRVGDVDTKRRRLLVRKTKSGKARETTVPTTVMEMLALDRDPREPLFLAPRGGEWQVDNFRNRVFIPAAGALGVQDLHVHDLRHTAASLMILSGATVKDVQNALGHQSAKMTLDLYAGWWDEGLDDISTRMDSLLA